ncbi:MAG: hypothetical protein RSA24_02735 [Clostridia bacterium]
MISKLKNLKKHKHKKQKKKIKSTKKDAHLYERLLPQPRLIRALSKKSLSIEWEGFAVFFLHEMVEVMQAFWGEVTLSSYNFSLIVND